MIVDHDENEERRVTMDEMGLDWDRMFHAERSITKEKRDTSSL